MDWIESERFALKEHKSVFGEYKNYSPPQYNKYRTESFYIDMKEGHKIAVDVTLPNPLVETDRIPAILYTTRYWRAFKDDSLNDLDLFFVRHGYAFIRADERGTGASFGTWPHMWPRVAISDYRQTVDWIVDQPWSNGTVGGIGVSYTGTTAQLLAATNHPAVKAVVPKFIEFDVYTDIFCPGGLFLDPLIEEYIERCRLLDLNKWTHSSRGKPTDTVKPVDDDEHGLILAEAIKEHKETNPDFSRVLEVKYRDDKIPGINVTIDDFSMHQLKEEIEQSGVPIYGWGSWHDACTADTVIRRFMTFDNPQRAVIGAWNHGGDKNANQYLKDYSPPQPSLTAQWLEDLRFFDQHLKCVETGVMDEGVLTYLTMGSETWERTTSWPIEGTEFQRLYICDGHKLSLGHPVSNTAFDNYVVDFSATTGEGGHWHTEFRGTDVIYEDRTGPDELLLTYTSGPLKGDLQVTGYPVITLYVSSNHTDGAFLVYLEDVAPDGHIRYVTGGELRAIHRKISDESPPYHMFMPNHTYKRGDAKPLVPGEITELVIGMQPTSVMFKKGHSIRVAISGHDQGVFSKTPDVEDEIVMFDIHRSSKYASRIELPVVLGQLS